MQLLLLHLQALSPQKNIFRDYSILVGKDLLGDWIVSITYGRINAKGTNRVYAFNSKEEAFSRVRAILQKRASANKRLGCTYKIREIKAPFSSTDERLSKVIALFEGVDTYSI